MSSASYEPLSAQDASFLFFEHPTSPCWLTTSRRRPTSCAPPRHAPDGANVEIRDAVGAENFFLFGLTAEEVRAAKSCGYRPEEVYRSDAELKETVDFLTSGFLPRGDRVLFRPLVASLLDRDEYMLLADYRSYLECQAAVSRRYADADDWARMSILNVARIGKFSSDRAIREYCADIWGTAPVPVTPVAG